jgi:HEAT repeat protein
MTDLERLIEAALAVPSDESYYDEYWAKVRQLHGHTDEATFRAAAALAESPDDSRAELGLDVLGQLGYELNYPFRVLTLPVVVSRLGAGESTRVLVAAIGATTNLGDPAALAPVLAHAGHRDGAVRLAVATELSYLAGDPPAASAVDALIALMADDSADVRDWATFGLGRQLKVDTPAVRAALAERLFDTEGDAADEALIGLAGRGDRRVISEILDRLSRPTVTYQVLTAAAELPDASYRPVLLQLRTEGWDGPRAYLDEAIAAADRLLQG